MARIFFNTLERPALSGQTTPNFFACASMRRFYDPPPNRGRYATIPRDMLMNEVTLKDVWRQLFVDEDFCKKQMKYLFIIQRWLRMSDDGKPCWTMPRRIRMACSLTARAEAELFGVSVPRFCVRLFGDIQRENFFNLRRSALLVERVKERVKDHGGWAKRQASPERRIEEAYEYDEHDIPELVAPSLIGDSVFAVPKHLQSSYRIISSQKLHAGYGEDLGENPDGSRKTCPATPFVQHFWTVGLCSHAVVFMAAILLEKHAKSIHALAEIAALLRSSDKDEILITGLSPKHVSKYFEKAEVGLKSYYQVSPVYLNLGENEQLVHGKQFDKDDCFCHALRSYLLSGMPVIKDVDLGRLHGFGGSWEFAAGGQKAIYQSNEAGFKLTAPPHSADQHHCVLLLGCALEQDSFVLHDPSGMPYLKASTPELMNASSYVGELSNASKTTAILTERAFHPVTPGAVLLPLHDAASSLGKTTRKIRGLYYIALHIFEEAKDNPHIDFAVPSRDEYLRGEFRLVQASALAAVFREITWHAHASGPISAEFISEVEEAQQILAAHGAESWYWVQRFAKSYWIWDAEMPPLESESYEIRDLCKYVVGIVWEDNRLEGGATRQRIFRSGDAAPGKASGADIGPKEPDPADVFTAVVTSFHGHSTQDALAYWPEETNSAELYCFMQQDVGDLLIPQKPYLSAVEAMSVLFEEGPEIDRIAESLDLMFSTRAIKIRGFATFIPELLDQHDSHRDMARRAIMFLCRLASALREREHRVDTVEMVGGSMIDGLLPIRYKEKRCILANRKISTDISLELLKQISLVAQCAGDNNVKLCIEAEPGPLFAFNTAIGVESLVALIEEMEERNELPQGVVGLNLDIGHWMLSHIEPSRLKSPLIRKRIFSAHISDHLKGHTGDAVPGDIEGIERFYPWIAELRGLPASTYSGKLSVEFECAGDRESINRAVSIVNRL